LRKVPRDRRGGGNGNLVENHEMSEREDGEERADGDEVVAERGKERKGIRGRQERHLRKEGELE